MTDKVKDVVIVGTGPYGLATAAYAKQKGLDYALLGKPMELWHSHMLDNMMLRSPIEWHMDPTDHYTIARFFKEAPRDRDPAAPLTRLEFLDYVEWFIEQHGIVTQDLIVERVSKPDAGHFNVRTQAGEILARNVVVATGLRQFRFVPEELDWLLETGRASHSSDYVTYDSLRNKTVLIVGGRQSAYEAVKEVSQSAQSQVHVSHRHPTPSFEQAHWEWNSEAVDHLRADPNWFSSQSTAEKEAIQQKFWSEGRLKLEPWLKEAAARPNVTIHPQTKVVKAEINPAHVEVQLSDGAQIQVDHVLFATGYRVNASKINLLADLLPDISVDDGFPVLDSTMQSSVAGLCFTGLFGARKFGPIFGFVLGCQVAPRILVDGIAGRR